MADSTDAGIGGRVRHARSWQGFTQRELAEMSGVSLSAIRKIEQGTFIPSLAILRRLSVPLDVHTTELVGVRLPQEPEAGGGIWAPARDAILAPGRADVVEADDGIAGSIAAAVRLYHGNRYAELAAVLPRLLADAEGAAPLLRSQAYQLAGSVMVQTRHREAARVALDRSLADAEATGDEMEAGSAVITLCWLLIVEGRFEEVRRLATEWVDRVEPRISTATVRDLSVWGWLLLRGSAAAVRDNLPHEAEEMMRLASAAAAATGREQGGYKMYWTTFGPATVAMKRVENAVVEGRPDVALRLAREVPDGLRPTSDNRNRHLLDVSAAHLDLHHWDDALEVLLRLNDEAGPWLAEQRMAAGQLRRITRKRRTWTPEMRRLAEVVRLEA